MAIYEQPHAIAGTCFPQRHQSQRLRKKFKFIKVMTIHRVITHIAKKMIGNDSLLD